MTDAADFFCSEVSEQVGEALYGTAPRTSAWFLLEYAARWEAKPLASDLPDPVTDLLRAALDAVPDSRFGFIRRQNRYVSDGGLFYVAVIRETDPVLYRFDLIALAELLALDLPALAAADPRYEEARTDDRLLLVCTHGRRDKCCARRGLPVYDALANRPGLEVWQTSHVGGHRFAANVVCLPQGIAYGRVVPEAAESLAAACRAGQIVPEMYRGRVCYPEPVQAAEYFLRRETGVNAVDAFRLVELVSAGGEAWHIRFEGADGLGYAVTLGVERVESFSYASCGDAERAAVNRYALQRIERDAETR